MNCILKPKRGRHLRQDGPHPSLTAILRFRTRITSLVLNGRSPD
jgi:hypothetical protein